MVTVRLSEILSELESGGRPKGGASDSDAGVLSIGGEHVNPDGSFGLGTKRYVPADYFENMRRGRIAREDILIVKDGATTGKVAFVGRNLPLPAAVNEHVFRLCVDATKALPRYVFFYLLSPTGNRQILKDFRGATVGGISQEFPDLVTLPLPSLAEQHRMAGILDQADHLVRTRRYALELSDSFLPAAFPELFQKADKWTEDELGNVCEKVLDCPHSTPVYTAVPSPHPCLRSSDIQKGYLDYAQTKYVSPIEYAKRVARGKPMRGDIIYCREGARFGNAARLLDDASACLGQRMMLFRVNRKLVTSEYVWAFLGSSAAYRQATRAMDGSASPHVNVGEILAFKIPVPPIPLQERFTNVVMHHDRLLAVQRESLRQAEHLFQSLLHSAFRPVQ